MDPRSPRISVKSAGFVSLVTLGLLLLFGCFLLSPGLLLAGTVGLIVWTAFRLLTGIPLKKISIERRLPKRALAGESFEIEVIIRNTSRLLPISDLCFRDPFSAHDRRVPTIAPNSTARLNYTGKYGKRGLVVSRRFPFQSSWPLQLFESSFQATCEEESRLTLLPSPFLPATLRQFLDRLELESHWFRPEQPDPASEFRLLREFRHGDPVRNIHWPSSLRCGALQVRETDPPGLKPHRNGIIVHSFTPRGQLVTPEKYEMILRIVIALLLRFRSRKMEILYFPGSGKPSLLSSANDFDQAIDELATIQRMPWQNPDPISEMKKAYLSCDQVFVLGDSSRELWEEQVRASIPGSTCIDSESLSSAARPTLKKKARQEAVL